MWRFRKVVVCRICGQSFLGTAKRTVCATNRCRHQARKLSEPLVSETGVIYFVQSGEHGPIKIGRTVNLDKRLREVQGWHWESLNVLATLPGGSRTEARLHFELREHRIRGEWFHAHPDVFAAAGLEPVLRLAV